jgi:RNA-binding protein
MLNLTVTQRRDLKARAHPLNPVVIIGNAGLTPAVLDEIERSLKSHDLMKIRIMNDDRDAREAMLQEICETLNAGPVQHIGKILVIYRPLAIPIAKAPKRRPGKSLTKKQIGSKGAGK